MPVYIEKVKDKKTGKMVDKLVGKDKKKQYYIRTYVEDEFGNKHQITRHNKKWLGRDGYRDAQQEEIVLRNEVFNKTKPKVITLIEAEKLYLESKYGKVDNDTLRHYKNLLNHFCKFKANTSSHTDIKKFNSNVYQNWQNKIKEESYMHGSKRKKYSIKYLNKIHNEVCKMLDFLIAYGYIHENFAKQCGPIGTTKEVKSANTNKVYETITYEEYLQLMNVSSNNKKYNTYFDLEFKRGPRIGEVRAFKIKDYNYAEKKLMVNHTMSKKNELKEPKTASSKAPIYLSDELNEKIYQLVQDLKKEDGYNEEWYIFNGPTPISENALTVAKEKYFRLANINKHLRTHDLRHSCATWLFSINTPITVISKILRHANINETMKTYTHLITSDYQKWLLKIDNYKLTEVQETRPKTRPKFNLSYKNPLFTKG